MGSPEVATEGGVRPRQPGPDAGQQQPPRPPQLAGPRVLQPAGRRRGVAELAAAPARRPVLQREGAALADPRGEGAPPLPLQAGSSPPSAPAARRAAAAASSAAAGQPLQPGSAGSITGGGGDGVDVEVSSSNARTAPSSRLTRPVPPAPPSLPGAGRLALHPPGLAPAPQLRLAVKPRQVPLPPRRPPPSFSDTDPHVAEAYGGLEVRCGGRAPPPPLASFNELVGRYGSPPRWRVSRTLVHNLAASHRLGQPTPVQRHVIPAIMEGRDVLAVSCTGSGKTLAYLLPLLAHLASRPRSGTKNRAWPEALVVVPTRELAEQVYSEARLLLRDSHVRPLLVTGGVSVAEQALKIRGRTRSSRGGMDLVVATPGRLLQMVDSRRAVALGRLGCVVVDEADRMMELGMWPELRRLLHHPSLPTARQTVLVSSSLPSPELRSAAGALLRDPVEVEVGDGSGTSRAVRQRIERLRDEDKPARLLELLAPRGSATAGVAGAAAAAAHSGGAPAPATATGSNNSTGGGGAAAAADADAGLREGPAVVFVNQLARAELVARHLASRGVGVALLHRELSQAQRDEAMQCFRFGVASVLVATGLAARGLNFPDVAHVVNYDVPLTASDYVHQVGRTGRGGRPGLATTLFTPSRYNRAATPWLRDALRASGCAVPHWLQCLAGEVEARGETERTRQKKAFAQPPAKGGPPAAEAAAAGARGVVPQQAAVAGGERSEGGSWGAVGRGAPGDWSRRRPVVDVSDADAASQVAFGAFLPAEPAARAGGSSLLAPRAAAGAAAGERAVVRDRRHDPAHWQAVFDAALRGAQAQPGAPYPQHQAPPGPRQLSRRRATAPGSESESGSEPSAETPRRRLLFQNGEVALEAGPGSGLSAGAGPESGMRRRRASD